jgi:hypothetical protein
MKMGGYAGYPGSSLFFIFLTFIIGRFMVLLVHILFM